jgi:hypothetical protein
MIVAQIDMRGTFNMLVLNSPIIDPTIGIVRLRGTLRKQGRARIQGRISGLYGSTRKRPYQSVASRIPE